MHSAIPCNGTIFPPPKNRLTNITIAAIYSKSWHFRHVPMGVELAKFRAVVTSGDRVIRANSGGFGKIREGTFRDLLRYTSASG
jgi:hypothetical protein